MKSRVACRDFTAVRDGAKGKNVSREFGRCGKSQEDYWERGLPSTSRRANDKSPSGEQALMQAYDWGGGA